ncbi:MAG: hypothetical protein M3082_17045 [Candidatus Dormibacteraeota bacterium]|nr:hypothetical protein [Candidatus Dormibacteraeota bacterium]
MLGVPRTVALLGVVGLVLAAVLITANAGAIRLRIFPTADDAAIRSVIHAGFLELQTSTVPAQPVCPGPVPEAVQQRMLGDLHANLPRSFTEPALSRYMALLGRNLSGACPVCSFGGGVSAVDLSSVSVSGAQAEARARVTSWDRVGQYQGNGRIVYAQPSGPQDCTIQLRKVSGAWLISDFVCTFPPGSGP